MHTCSTLKLNDEHAVGNLVNYLFINCICSSCIEVWLREKERLKWHWWSWIWKSKTCCLLFFLGLREVISFIIRFSFRKAFLVSYYWSLNLFEINEVKVKPEMLRVNMLYCWPYLFQHVQVFNFKMLRFFIKSMMY